MIPVARRVLRENGDLTLMMRKLYARSILDDPAASLDDLRESVSTLAETERIMRRVLGDAHPQTEHCVLHLREARAALRTRETSSAGTG